MSGAAESEFRAAYDAVLARWPVPAEPIVLPSAYGTTRVNACGPAGAPALVLLPGGGATSTVWFANVAELSRDHRVYAIDPVTDPGDTGPDARPVRTAAADLMDRLAPCTRDSTCRAPTCAATRTAVGWRCGTPWRDRSG